MPGPLQYGNGIKALTIDLLVAQMLSLRRCTELEHAITGIKISEATLLGYIERINDSLQPWKAGAKKLLLTRPALHVDETGFRVDKKNWWLHVATDGSLTLKYLHRKRGKEAIDAFGIIPFYFGVLILNSAVGARQSSGKLLMLNQCLCLESSTMANSFGEAL